MSEQTRRAEARFQRDALKPVDERGVPVTRSAMFAVRVTPDERDAIAALAVELGVSQSALVVRRVLGRVPDALEVRLLRAEARVARLERRTYGVVLSDAEIDGMSEAGL